MLKYQINTKAARTDLQMLNISNVESTEVPFEGRNKVLLTCYLGERNVVHENDTVVMVYEVNIPKVYSDESMTTIVEEYTVVGVNEENLSFNIVYDKFREMDAEFARKETFVRFNNDGTSYDVSYLIIFFSTYHNIVSDPINNMCTVYLSDNVSTSVEQLVKLEGEVIDSYSLRFELNDLNKDAYDRIFSLDVFKAQNYAPLTHFKILQENFLFAEDYQGSLLNANFYIQKNVGVISLPITNMFATDLYKSISFDGFVNKQVEMALNKTAENEKDIYRPIIKSGNNIKDVRKIKFNFHFRQRYDEQQWLVDPKRLWNGVQILKGENENTYKLHPQFFSYTKKENQSDLLGYLSFTDADVKYRRNALKKSFVRLLFYDSTDPFKQRLLSYSTIFVDTGTLLDRYMKNVSGNSLGLNYIQYRENDLNVIISEESKGIRVNKELCSKTKLSEDVIEDCRLSSQLVVSDKFLSTGSSEGFYLYLWKDNVGDGIPNDIYMKVEYNHAKFGRVLPFMMPYDDFNGKKVIKSFKNVVDDVFNNRVNDENDFNNGYTVEEYQKYSYIHFKYERFDDIGGYVYYLDEDYANVETDGNTLILNLYEANVK